MFGKKQQETFYSNLIGRAKGSSFRILLPESTDERVLQSAAMAATENLCQIVLIGKSERFEGVFSKSVFKKLQFLDMANKELQMKYAKKLVELRKEKGMTEEQAMELVCQPMYFSVLAAKCGDVDGIVAGATTSTPDVLRPAFQVIKTAPDTKIASSVFFVESQNKKIGENGTLVFADCGVVEYPTSEELCEIALQSAKTAVDIGGFCEPKVALLSHSSKSQSQKLASEVQKVKDAFLMLRRKKSDLLCDGELQLDAALVPSVAKQKCPHSSLAGRANVLVFPDIDAGNIGYKVSGVVGGATCIGPIVQGLAKPVNDVSRGATSDEILGAIAVTVLQCKNNNRK